jgi:hypothetical protein
VVSNLIRDMNINMCFSGVCLKIHAEKDFAIRSQILTAVHCFNINYEFYVLGGAGLISL